MTIIIIIITTMIVAYGRASVVCSPDLPDVPTYHVYHHHRHAFITYRNALAERNAMRSGRVKTP